MSDVLQEEVDQMSEEEILERIDRIRKSELSYKRIREYNGQYQSWIYSLEMLVARYKSSITEEDRQKTYSNYDDIEIHNYIKYIYLN